MTKSILVEDQAIVDARQLLWDQVRVAAEPGGVVALAALLAGAYVPRRSERVAVVISRGKRRPEQPVTAAANSQPRDHLMV